MPGEIALKNFRDERNAADQDMLHQYQNELLDWLQQVDRDKDLKSRLKAETGEHPPKLWVWGDASQEAYKKHVDWLERNVLPATAKKLMESGQKQTVQPPEFFNWQFKDGRASDGSSDRTKNWCCNLQIDASHPPSVNDLTKIDRATRWCKLAVPR